MLKTRKLKNSIFGVVCLAATCLGVITLLVLLVSLWDKGNNRLDSTMLNSYPARVPERAGALPAIMGSLWIVVLTGFIAVPIGIAAAIYLEEYQRKKNAFVQFIQLNIANLAGVPSIVYGLLGLALFVRMMSLGRSVLAGSLTMALLILPTVIIVSQEALKAVPKAYREGSLALGASDWQTISRQVLPAALPGIFTGVILAMSRAIGETAPLIVVGAVVFTRNTPDDVWSSFTVLPIQIYNWTSDPKAGFHDLAGSAILVLMVVLLSLNSFAIYLRQRQIKKLA